MKTASFATSGPLPAAAGGRTHALCSDSKVRLSYTRFPRWSQPWWTWLTGKPLAHEAAPRSLTPVLRLITTLGLLAALSGWHMLMIGAADPAWRLAGVLLSPIFWVVTTGAWRSLQVFYGHYAVHRTLVSRRPALNALIARLLTVLALVQNECDYESDHMAHHRPTVFAAMADADAALMFRLGFRPGTPERQLRRTLWLTLFSPAFHGHLLAVRLKSSLRRPMRWCMLVAAWWLVVLVGLPWAFGLVPTLMAVWLPLFVLYQASALLQFSTEHLWLLPREPAAGLAKCALQCHGRFCGEMVPGQAGQTASWRAWLGWWARLFALHLPVRLAVLVGDLPAHDWHHLCSVVRHKPCGWTSALHQRQRAIDSGQSAGMETRELWGLDAMLGHVLGAMSRAPAIAAGKGAPE